MDPIFTTTGLLILAVAIATMIRLEDFPQIEWTKDNIGKAIATALGTTVSVIFFAWMLAETAALYIDTVGGFVVITTAGVGGIAGVRAAINKLRDVMTADDKEE